MRIECAFLLLFPELLPLLLSIHIICIHRLKMILPLKLPLRPSLKGLTPLSSLSLLSFLLLPLLLLVLLQLFFLNLRQILLNFVQQRVRILVVYFYLGKKSRVFRFDHLGVDLKLQEIGAGP